MNESDNEVDNEDLSLARRLSYPRSYSYVSSLHLVDVMHLDGKASGNKDVFHDDDSSSNCVNERDDYLLLHG